MRAPTSSVNQSIDRIIICWIIGWKQEQLKQARRGDINLGVILSSSFLLSPLPGCLEVRAFLEYVPFHYEIFYFLRTRRPWTKISEILSQINLSSNSTFPVFLSQQAKMDNTFLQGLELLPWIYLPKMIIISLVLLDL